MRPTVKYKMPKFITVPKPFRFYLLMLEPIMQFSLIRLSQPVVVLEYPDDLYFLYKGTFEWSNRASYLYERFAGMLR